jgi:hypothetical protein
MGDEERRDEIKRVLREQGVSFNSRQPIYRHQVERFHDLVADALVEVIPASGDGGERVTDEMVERGARAIQLSSALSPHMLARAVLNAALGHSAEIQEEET